MSFVPRHFHLLNTCRNTSNVFSCAIDCFIELCFYAISPFFDRVTTVANPDTSCTGFWNRLILSGCEKYKQHTQDLNSDLNSIIYEILAEEVRAPIWQCIQEKCPSFQARDCNAVFFRNFQIKCVWRNVQRRNGNVCQFV